jgi:hypothetical protein
MLVTYGDPIVIRDVINCGDITNWRRFEVEEKILLDWALSNGLSDDESGFVSSPEHESLWVGLWLNLKRSTFRTSRLPHSPP